MKESETAADAIIYLSLSQKEYKVEVFICILRVMNTANGQLSANSNKNIVMLMSYCYDFIFASGCSTTIYYMQSDELISQLKFTPCLKKIILNYHPPPLLYINIYYNGH